MKIFNLRSCIILAIVALFITNCSKKNKDSDPDTTPVEPGKYKTELAFPAIAGIDSPVELTSPDDGSNRIFVVSQKGMIYQFNNNSQVNKADLFLDISDKVGVSEESGLLGLAFHPNYKTNGYFYVFYSIYNGGPQTVISRFKVNASNPNIADASSEEVLLTFDRTYYNHNGGKLAFGNDGLLYISVGDGGNVADPQKKGQDRKTLLGKMLRIDVDKTEPGKKYAIPADNPFKSNTEGFKEEIYAYGLRNPWRFSFDRSTRKLWLADVGQSRQEEIDLIEKGGNYGWSIMEGTECLGGVDCNKTGLNLPLYSYGRTDGGSITGGYVSHDKNLQNLAGRYIYGDFVSGKIWALTYSGNTVVRNDLVASVSPGTLSSFGQDSTDGLYVLNYKDGKIYKFVADK